jgi:hypothetical protein
MEGYACDTTSTTTKLNVDLVDVVANKILASDRANRVNSESSAQEASTSCEGNNHGYYFDIPQTYWDGKTTYLFSVVVHAAQGTATSSWTKSLECPLATQGSGGGGGTETGQSTCNISSQIYVNQGTTFSVSGLPSNPKTATTVWGGTDLPTSPALTGASVSTTYKTVGTKIINATTTGTLSTDKPFMYVCSTTTKVKLSSGGGGGI